jgi:GDPmannose 4,6-dehydratase
LGNIEVKKEFNFAGDIVEAIWILLQQNKIYEVVIGSGLPFSIKEWAKACFEFLNMNWQYHIEIDSSFVPEYSLLVSNPALISSLGWKPKISFHELVRMMMTDDKNYY